MPLRRSHLLLCALSLTAAALGILLGLVVCAFVPGEGVGVVGFGGLALAFRAAILRTALSSEPGGWVLASTAIPFCLLLLPGGLQRLVSRHSALARALCGGVCPPAPAWLEFLSHDALRDATSGNLTALLAATLFLALSTSGLHATLLTRTAGAAGGGDSSRRDAPCALPVSRGHSPKASSPSSDDDDTAASEGVGSDFGSEGVSTSSPLAREEGSTHPHRSSAGEHTTSEEWSTPTKSLAATLHAERLKRLAASPPIARYELPSGSLASLELESLPGAAIGSVLWPGAHTLVTFLGSPTGLALIRGERAVELGAGIGFVGLAARALGAAHVVITDADDSVLDLARANVARNASAVGGGVEVAALAWGARPWRERAAVLQPACRLLLCSDVVYREDSAALLVETLESALTGGGVCILSYKERGAGARFFDALTMRGVTCEEALVVGEQRVLILRWGRS